MATLNTSPLLSPWQHSLQQIAKQRAKGQSVHTPSTNDPNWMAGEQGCGNAAKTLWGIEGQHLTCWWRIGLHLKSDNPRKVAWHCPSPTSRRPLRDGQVQRKSKERRLVARHWLPILNVWLKIATCASNKASIAISRVPLGKSSDGLVFLQ